MEVAWGGARSPFFGEGRARARGGGGAGLLSVSASSGWQKQDVLGFSGASKGGMKVGMTKDSLYKGEYPT